MMAMTDGADGDVDGGDVYGNEDFDDVDGFCVDFDDDDALIHRHLVADRRLNLNELKETFHLKKVKMKKNRKKLKTSPREPPRIGQPGPS